MSHGVENGNGSGTDVPPITHVPAPDCVGVIDSSGVKSSDVAPWYCAGSVSPSFASSTATICPGSCCTPCAVLPIPWPTPWSVPHIPCSSRARSSFVQLEQTPGDGSAVPAAVTVKVTAEVKPSCSVNVTVYVPGVPHLHAPGENTAPDQQS